MPKLSPPVRPHQGGPGGQPAPPPTGGLAGNGTGPATPLATPSGLAEPAARRGAGPAGNGAGPAVPVDPDDFRLVLGRFATGVVVVATVTAGGAPAGMAVTSFTSVSLEPPLVGFCAGRRSRTWPHIRAAGHFGVSILRAGQAGLSHRFAGTGDDKFAGIAWHPAPSGAPVLDDALAWVDCELHASFPAGDHVIVLGRVLALHGEAGMPLVRYHGSYGGYQPQEQPPAP